jgi:hypothetical protein
MPNETKEFFYGNTKTNELRGKYNLEKINKRDREFNKQHLPNQSNIEPLVSKPFLKKTFDSNEIEGIKLNKAFKKRKEAQLERIKQFELKKIEEAKREEKTKDQHKKKRKL